MKALPLSEEELDDLVDRAGTLNIAELTLTWFRLLETLVKVKKENLEMFHRLNPESMGR